jgi:hypothetical protein
MTHLIKTGWKAGAEQWNCDEEKIRIQTICVDFYCATTYIDIVAMSTIQTHDGGKVARRIPCF